MRKKQGKVGVLSVTSNPPMCETIRAEGRWCREGISSGQKAITFDPLALGESDEPRCYLPFVLSLGLQYVVDLTPLPHVTNNSQGLRDRDRSC